MDQKKITAESYTLETENGGWLGQVILTSDGAFMAITDYGNFNYAWRSFGDNFKEFICNLNTSYFADKMCAGMAYVAYGRKIEKSAERFSEKILPALQKVLKEEINSNKQSK